jgi:hypothetical protein
MPDQVRHDGLTDFMDRHYLVLFLSFYQIINDFSNLFKDFFFPFSGVNHLHPAGFFPGNGKVSFSNPSVKFNLFSFKTFFSFLFQRPIPLNRSLQSYIRRTIEKEGHIRPDALRGEVIEALNPF